MASQDRSYYRDSQDWRPSPLSWLLGGSVQMLAAGGLRIRIHTSAVLAAILYLAAGVSNLDFPLRMLSIAVVLLLALVHEAGRCMAARTLGGSAGEVLLWPLGGLVDPQPPHRPLPVLITALAGPLMNLAICAGCWLGLTLLGQPGPATLNPLLIALPTPDWSAAAFYLHAVFTLSYLMLTLNLLPILPLDGGRLLQGVLWPAMGYGRALLASCSIAMMLASALGIFALATGHWLLLALMLACLLISYQRRLVVKTAGAWSYGEADSDMRHPPDPRHPTSPHPMPHTRHHLSRFTKWRARRQIRREEAEQGRVDEILAKVYRSGMRSLTWRERRLLRRATQRQRELAMEEPSFHL